MKDLVEAGQTLKRLLDQIRAHAELTIRDPDSDGRAFAMLVAETSIPSEVLETLAIETEHLRLTWNKNRASARSVARRRERNAASPSYIMEDE
jgi:hypothetical protein